MMKARNTKRGITISNVDNESLLERLTEIVEQSGCDQKWNDHGQILITGNKKSIEQFIEIWNE